METGRTVILLNLENLYESLYDVLNQYYMYSGGVRYVDLGLQTHRVKCRVHPNFKWVTNTVTITVTITVAIKSLNFWNCHKTHAYIEFHLVGGGGLGWTFPPKIVV